MSARVAVPKALKLASDLPNLKDATMLLALTGWMDGGDVSTGSVRQIMAGRKNIQEVARIEPDEFYIYNFPGNMEISALFRPTVKYKQGVVRRFEMPANLFAADAEANLIFFIGKEPNLRWQSFADCIFEVTRRLNVKRIVFMGSFGGSIPHTREPRLYGTVSHQRLRDELKQYGVRLSDYEGPSSISSLLLADARKHDVEMLSLVAEIPGYLQGTNPISIEAIARRLGRMLNQPIDFDSLREASNEWESRVTAAIAENEELAQTVRKLEEEYDNELIEAEGS